MHPAPPRPALRLPAPATFAHRGGAGLWPENTLLAFAKSIALGIDVIETDVRLTRDGELVLCHDATIDRTTNGRGPLARLTLAELRRYDAAARFTRDGSTFPFRDRGLCVPTLAEALALDPKVRFNLDLKDDDPALVGRLIDAIELGGFADRIVVASHTDATVARFRSGTLGRVATAAGPREVATFLAAVQLGQTRRLRPAYAALQVPERRWLLRILDRAFVAAAHELGVAVHVFTIDAPATMRELLHLGVDGLMTNRPDRLVEVAAWARSSANPPEIGGHLGAGIPIS